MPCSSKESNTFLPFQHKLDIVAVLRGHTSAHGMFRTHSKFTINAVIPPTSSSSWQSLASPSVRPANDDSPRQNLTLKSLMQSRESCSTVCLIVSNCNQRRDWLRIYVSIHCVCIQLGSSPVSSSEARFLCTKTSLRVRWRFPPAQVWLQLLQSFQEDWQSVPPKCPSLSKKGPRQFGGK